MNILRSAHSWCCELEGYPVSKRLPQPPSCPEHDVIAPCNSIVFFYPFFVPMVYLKVKTVLVAKVLIVFVFVVPKVFFVRMQLPEMMVEVIMPMPMVVVVVVVMMVVVIIFVIEVPVPNDEFWKHEPYCDPCEKSEGELLVPKEHPL
ncbi:hypothetical protein BXZ70DRAFT_947591 [Cristinia sonorae]|uniref:Transmembrane protein n=1 Tax=Cristinia sonorae TaxID=1940300 RepID=A0A8K0XMP1_9AGAR|nr:hypothetical protein BXZ70DRAFT_947591 [Cristinia sonorae]